MTYNDDNLIECSQCGQRQILVERTNETDFEFSECLLCGYVISDEEIEEFFKLYEEWIKLYNCGVN